ncbi:Dabb family protein [Clostridium tarantellae]|uniref:Dabb family protein n=1 Tax=Clostridium tarantellae TaxID=39493 RepID=A0A6I1MUT5_9CLOT|nr:Dabb family protein [Clostridium tarantellae]MPQ44601.1 Dabb family protein [Clostridium tarantellae]
MIKHIVMWKLKDFAEGNEKAINAEKIKNSLEDLKSMIVEIKAIEVGINLNDSDKSYDVVLYSEFESMDTLKLYQKHPEHVKVGEFVRKVVEQRAVVDYKIEDII